MLRGVRLPAFAVVVALMAACTPTTGGSGPTDTGPGTTSLVAPRVLHGDTSVTFTWDHGQAYPEGGSYEWEWRQYGLPEAPWSTLTSEAPQVEVSTGLVTGRSYWLRVRYVDSEGVPAPEWSSGAQFFFADLTLPVVRIDTVDAAPVVSKETYLDASMSIDPNGSGYDSYAGTIQIRGRGNSTWSAPKKPYKIKLDTKSSLMGMSANKNWVLLANYFDGSHLRNYLAFEMSRQTNLAFTPTFRFVEVILNGSYDGSSRWSVGRCEGWAGFIGST